MAKHTVTVTLLKNTDGAELSATFDTVDTSKVQAADIIGEKTETGEYTGLASMALLYQYHNVVLNILAAPGWSHIPAVYKAMVSTIQKLNGHWDGFVHADVPLEDKKPRSTHSQRLRNGLLTTATPASSRRYTGRRLRTAAAGSSGCPQ